MRHNPGYGIMAELMASGREIRLNRVEHGRVRQGDSVGARRIVRAVAAVDDADRDRLKEIAHPGRQFADRGRVGRLGVVVPRQPVDLR